MATAPAKPTKSFTWTAALIRRLRGKRTQAEFARFVGATKNTVWRWESGRVAPDPASRARLTRLAERERFSPDWTLAGSIRILGDIEEGSRLISRALKRGIERRIREFGK